MNAPGRVLPLLAVAVFVCACEARSVASHPRPVVRFSRSPYIEQLVQQYRRLLPDVAFELVREQPIAGAGTSPGDADVALMLADSAFRADTRLSPPTLRAIGVLHVAPLHLLARTGSGIRRLRDLRGRRVGTVLGDYITESVLKTFQLDDAVTRVGPYPRLQGNMLAQSSIEHLFASNTLDALFIVNFYPATVVADAIRSGAELVPIEGPTSSHLSVEYPFVQWISIPAHVYPGQERRVRTLALPVLLACRSDLDDTLVYRLAEHLLEAVSNIPLYSAVLRHIAIEDASATPIPLHDGAARYYREWELLR